MGDSEYPLTEIGVEAEQIYATVVAQVRRLFRCLRVGWIDHRPHFRSGTEVNIGLSSEVYESGIIYTVIFSTFPSLTPLIMPQIVMNVFRNPFPSNCLRYVALFHKCCQRTNEQRESD